MPMESSEQGAAVADEKKMSEENGQDREQPPMDDDEPVHIPFSYKSLTTLVGGDELLEVGKEHGYSSDFFEEEVVHEISFTKEESAGSKALIKSGYSTDFFDDSGDFFVEKAASETSTTKNSTDADEEEEETSFENQNNNTSGDENNAPEVHREQQQKNMSSLNLDMIPEESESSEAFSAALSVATSDARPLIRDEGPMDLELGSSPRVETVAVISGATESSPNHRGVSTDSKRIMSLVSAQRRVMSPLAVISDEQIQEDLDHIMKGDDVADDMAHDLGSDMDAELGKTKKVALFGTIRGADQRQSTSSRASSRRGGRVNEAEEVQRLAHAYETHAFKQSGSRPNSVDDANEVEQLARVFETRKESPAHNNESGPLSKAADQFNAAVVAEHEHERDRRQVKKELRAAEEERVHKLMLRIFWYSIFALAGLVAVGVVVLSILKTTLL